MRNHCRYLDNASGGNAHIASVHSGAASSGATRGRKRQRDADGEEGQEDEDDDVERDSMGRALPGHFAGSDIVPQHSRTRQKLAKRKGSMGATGLLFIRNVTLPVPLINL